MDSKARNIIEGLETLDIKPNDTLLVHSSYKSLGTAELNPIEILKLIIGYLNKGTLILPALSYEHVTPQNPCFDNRKTSSCVGHLPEVFRTNFNVIRSNHPTHSVCAIGKEASSLTYLHGEDDTPCGKNSPFSLLPNFNGKILMLGCGLKPNTFMHSVEELIEPEYLFGESINYSMIDHKGHFHEKIYRTHGFKEYSQRYDKVLSLNKDNWIKIGNILKAQCYVLDSSSLREKSLEIMKVNKNYFVDKN